MSWTLRTQKSTSEAEAALADDAIDVGGSECLLRRQDRAGLIKGNITMYNKMHEWSLYPFEAEFFELKDASITGDALSAKHLNDAAALSYVIELVTERFQQYDLSNLFSKFPVLDMAIISRREWTSTFIDLLSRDQFNPILNQVIKSSPSIMSWAIETFTIKIGEAAALADDVVIDVGGNECLLKRADRAALIKNSVAMYNKMNELSPYLFEAEFVEMKEVPITKNALSANRLNDISAALGYVLKLGSGHLHQYDHLNLFTMFPVLDMNKISQGTAWNNHFIDLFLWMT